MLAQLGGSPKWDEPTKVDLFVNFQCGSNEDDTITDIRLTINQSKYDGPTHGHIELVMSFAEVGILASRLLHAIGEPPLQPF